MKKAFDTWSKAADINFRKTSKTSSADITIRFARREHGDGYENAFDGKCHFGLIKNIRFHIFLIFHRI